MWARRWMVPSALGLIVAMVLAAVGLRMASGRTYEYLYDFSVAAIAFGTLGALILRQRPAHRVAVFLVALASAWGVQVLAGSAAVASSSGMLAALSAALRFGIFGIFGFVLLLFPKGTLLSSSWRWVGWVLGVGAAASAFGALAARGPVEDIPSLSNPIGFLPPDVIGLPFILVVVGLLGSAASAVVRFRRARGEERQQLKLFSLAVAGTATLIVATNVAFPRLVEETVLGNIVWDSPLVLLPAAIAAAILRHGLYDIDRIVSRTLTYATLTAILFGAYSLIVVAIGAIVRPVVGSTDIVVALATLTVAACFVPVRRRVQGFIDRRFDRARYDAVKTIDAFTAHLRDEVDLASLAAEFTDVVRHTMAPASLSLWLRDRPSRSTTVSE